MKYPETFEPLTVYNGDISVTWEYDGEGYDLDYDPSDPDDVPLLRVYLYYKNELIPDAVYCTAASTATRREELVESSQYLMNEINTLCVKNGQMKYNENVVLDWNTRSYSESF